MIYEVTEGTTKKLKFRLKYVDENGTVQTLNTTGMTITLQLTKEDLTLVDTSGNIMPLAPGSSGLVEYSPDATDFVIPPGAQVASYLSKFKVVDGTGEIDFFPRGEHDVCKIRKP